MTAGRFVANGDSFTEGVGDPHALYPNGYRGWADRVARQLGRADEEWEYANLAIRSKLLDQVVTQQLAPALALRPTHLSFYAGGNDLLSLRVDVAELLLRYEQALSHLTGSGAVIFVFTAFDLPTTRLLEPLRRRVLAFNAGVREAANRQNAVLLDHTVLREYEHPALWAADRIHMSRLGHKRMAAFVMSHLEVPHTLKLKTPPTISPAPWLKAAREEAHFVRSEVIPLLQRRATGRNQGDLAKPKWPQPIRPSEGMKRLAAAQAHERAKTPC